MIVSRFTSFAKNFVIHSDEVTKMSRSGHDCTSTSSARSPYYLCERIVLGKGAKVLIRESAQGTCPSRVPSLMSTELSHCPANDHS